jgi:hypothetical protein
MQENEDHELISEEWQRLCSWLRGKANNAIAESNDAMTKSSIETEVATLCRDVPPTKSLLSAWRKIFDEATETWETQRAIDQVVRIANVTPSSLEPRRMSDR